MAYTQYLGETDAKRVARYQMALTVNKLVRTHPLPLGRAVTLCGNTAGDVGCMRDLMGFKPEQCIFVESNREHRHGLTKAKRMWPGIETYFGKIESLLEGGDHGWPLAFLNADCTGRLTTESHTMSILKAASRKLVRGSIMSFTHFRGRDQVWEKPFGNSMTFPRPPGMSMEEHYKIQSRARFTMYGGAVQRLLGGPGFKLVKVLTYDAQRQRRDHRHSPMGMLIFRNVSHSHLPSAIGEPWEEIKRADNIGVGDAEIRLRNSVVALIHKGYDTYKISGILNLSEPRIRAWRAHETRGTYQ